MMNVLACYNIKGGVGKTAAAVNLSCLAAREGFRTLVWDLDPQGAASYYFRIKPKVRKGGKGLVDGKRTLDEVIKGTDYDNLDLVPADFSYRNLDLMLEGKKKPVGRLRKLLKPLGDEYDYVFFDCPPSISLVSENVFVAANALLVPTIPTTLSLRTLDQIIAFCREQGYGNLQVLPFVSMVDRRKNLHREIVDELSQSFATALHSQIPYASDIEQMGVRRAAVVSYAAQSQSARAFEALWAEVKRHLGVEGSGDL